MANGDIFWEKVEGICATSKTWWYIYNVWIEYFQMTLVEGDPKALFSIATTPRCRGGHNSISWMAPLYPWSLSYNAVLSKLATSTIFNSLVWLDLRLHPNFPEHWRRFCSRRYFDLARKLIRRIISPNKDDLSYSSWTSFPGQQKLGKLPNTFSLAKQSRPVQTFLWRLFNSSNSIDTWGNLSNLWIPCV